MQLSDEQSRAVKHIGDRANWRNGHAWLAGYAGTGKTTIARYVEDSLRARRALYVAPTNKAAKVLSEKIGKQAISIHKAVYFPPEEQPAGKLGWTVNPNGPASAADLIICDEASMVGVKLGTDLKSFSVPIVAIGDPGQLPPVNDDPFFCVGQPDFLLTEIHRQARDNPIIALSQDVREKKRLRHGSLGDAVTIAGRGEVDIPISAMPQIIVGTHRRRWQITSAVRALLGHEGWLPDHEEPLVCRKNSEHHGELINGEEATAIKVEPADASHTLNVWTNLNPDTQPYKVWDGLFREHKERARINPEYLSEDWIAMKQQDCFDFGWAITCHVAQGSQWDDVLVYDESRVFREDASRWLYTAVTRAAKRLTVII